MRPQHAALAIAVAAATLPGLLPRPACAQLPSHPVQLSGSVRLRPEGWDWFGAGDEGEYAFLGALARAALVQQRPKVGWRLELAAPLLAGLPGDAALPPPRGQLGLGAGYRAASGGRESAGSLFLKQAFVRLGRPAAQGGHSLRAGRFEFVDGAESQPADTTLAWLKQNRVAHRLIGHFGWTHVGRSFDGAHYAFDRGPAHLTAAAFRPTQGALDVNGWPELDVALAYGAFTRTSADTTAGGRRRPGEWRLFVLGYVDYRDEAAGAKVDNRPAALRSADRARVEVVTLGGHYLRAVRTGAGTLDALLWGVLQGGDWGALRHRAWAASAEVGLQPAGVPALRPWLRIGWTRGSGDDDPGDGTHATFFQVVPTPRVYARFPFHNLMNADDLFAMLVLRPGSRLTVRADVHRLELAEAADLWYSGGGAFEAESFGYAGRPSGGASALATTVDVSAELRLGARLTASLFLSHAFAGHVVEGIYGAGGGRLGYLELEYRR
jgi:hypothetical protein